MRVYLLVIYILLLVTKSVTANQPIVFADSPYPPYVLGSLTDKEPQGGTAIDLVNQLFADLPEYQVSFRLFPWKRALLELEKGSVDGVTMIAKTPEREKYLDFTAPLLEYELALFYASSAFPEGFEWTQLSDLRDYRIGVVDGYLSDSKLNELVDQGNYLNLIRLSGTESQLFGMLLKGRVDLICFKRESGQTLLRQKNWVNDIQSSTRSVYQGSYHLGFSKAQQHGVLIEKLNVIINKWQSNGKLEAILHPHSPP